VAESAPVPPPASDASTNSEPSLTAANESTPSLLPDIKRKDPNAPPAEESRALPIDPSRPNAAAPENSHDSLLSPPQEALKHFLAAPTWKQRLEFSQLPEKVSSDMQEYYLSYPDGPQSPTSITFMTSARTPDGKNSLYLFHVTFPDLPQGFPIAVEETSTGWRVDWRSFVEFRDSQLKKFLAQYQERPATFQVKLQRTHYFDQDVPKLDDKYCFRISAPIYGHDGYAFVDKSDSIVGPKIVDKLNWDGSYHVIAKLKWVTSPSGHQYIELRDIVAESWRADQDPRLGKS
jgi:hypothetical protein